MNAWGGGGGGRGTGRVPATEFCLGGYYVSCQKRLCKIKYGFEDLTSNVSRGSRPGSTHYFYT